MELREKRERLMRLLGAIRLLKIYAMLHLQPEFIANYVDV